jgi:hypothetical protein
LILAFGHKLQWTIALAALSNARLHEFYEMSKLFVDLPELICGKLRSVRDTLIGARHLLVPNVWHEGVVENAR